MAGIVPSMAGLVPRVVGLVPRVVVQAPGRVPRVGLVLRIGLGPRVEGLVVPRVGPTVVR